MSTLAPAPLRGTLLGLVLCATPLAQAGHDGSRTAAPRSPSGTLLSEPATRVVELLRASRLRGAPSVAETVSAIAVHAQDSLPELSGWMLDRQLPALSEDQKPQILSVPQRDMLLSALETLPPVAVRREATRLLDLDNGIETRRTVIRMLGACASAGDIPDLVDLTRPHPDEPPGVLELEALRWSLTRLVLRDPLGMGELADLVHVEDRSLVSSVIKVIGEVGDSRGLELLLQVAIHNPDLAPLAIAQIRRVGRSAQPAINDEFGEFLRGDLDPNEPTRCRAAIIALGELAHFDAAQQLIDLLQTSESLRGDCLWALRRMTGLRFSDDALRWRRWHEAETSWYKRELPYLLRDLHGRSQVRATAAVTAISAHRIHRHALAEELAQALLNAPPIRQRALCAALGAMDSEAGIPALLDTLGSPEEGAKLAAHRALLSLTGLRLPAEQSAWEVALGARPEAPAIAAPR